MSNFLWNSLLIIPGVLVATGAVSDSTIAAENKKQNEVAQNEEIADFWDRVSGISSGNSNQTSILKGVPASIATTAVGEAPLTAETYLATSVLVADVANSQNLPPAPVLPANSIPIDASLSQIDQYSNETAQVTSVSQLSDIQPTDWAFKALQSLVERYGCIEGYPDRTYRGNRAMTRYEFAAGLNACLDRIQELIAASTSDLPSAEDIATIRRLQEEFAAELVTLRGRVNALETRTAQLEANQFSTTTKLNGEVIFSIASVVDGENANGEEIDRVPVFANRVRLNFDTSFTGKDLLRTRLQSSNVLRFPTGTSEGRFAYGDVSSNAANDIILDVLQYRFPLGSNTTAYLAANATDTNLLGISPPLNPFFEDTGSGAISRFGVRPPINRYLGGTGAALRHRFNNFLELDLAYLAGSGSAANPTDGNGLFNGSYGALAQLIISPSNNFKLGLTYINAYNPNFSGTGTGSIAANSPGIGGTSVTTNAYGLSGTLRFSPNFLLNGWAGYANQRYLGRGDGKVWNWAVTLGFPDLGKKGNLLGIVAGMEPKLTDVSGSGVPIEDRDTSLHLEGFYRYQLTDNISVTPGVIWLTAPNHNEANKDIFIGVLRTVFKF